MRNIVDKTCTEIGCVTQPSFGMPDNSHPIRCAAHKLHGMVNLVSRTCTEIGCFIVNPTFGMPEDERPSRCATHKQPGMEFIAKWKCTEIGCCTSSSFGMPDDARPSRCAEHKQYGMENIRSRRCAEYGCKSQPSWPGRLCAKCYFEKNPDCPLANASNKTEKLVQKFLRRCVDICLIPPCDMLVDTAQPHLGRWRMDIVLTFEDGFRMAVEIDGAHHVRDAVFDARQTAAEVRSRDVRKAVLELQFGTSLQVRLLQEDVWRGVRFPGMCASLPDAFDWASLLLHIVAERENLAQRCNVLFACLPGEQRYDLHRDDMQASGLQTAYIAPGDASTVPDVRSMVWGEEDSTQTRIDDFFK